MITCGDQKWMILERIKNLEANWEHTLVLKMI
jgi:hypothetical protein